MTKPAGSRPGIREVAQRAGVSVTTVSRVLNDLPRVDPQTRARIQAVMEEMKYLRHGAARALSSRRSQTVGVVVPLLGLAVFSEAVQALEERLQELHYYLLIASCGYSPEKEVEVVRSMVERGVDGLVLVGQSHLPATHTLIERAGIPVVQTFTSSAESLLPCIGFDNYTPAFELTSHIADLGHRDVAVLHGRLRANDRIKARFDGIVDGLAARRLAPHPDNVIEVGPTIADGRGGLDRLLRNGRPFTAIACTGDVTAVGVLAEARQRGVAVPQQFSVTGFHDLDFASHTDPPLTTVHAPVQEMARAAADYLVAAIAGENPASRLSLPTTIVLRKSLGPCPGQPAR